jgi:hypothetical protein
MAGVTHLAHISRHIAETAVRLIKLAAIQNRPDIMARLEELMLGTATAEPFLQASTAALGTDAARSHVYSSFIDPEELEVAIVEVATSIVDVTATGVYDLVLVPKLDRVFQLLRIVGTVRQRQGLPPIRKLEQHRHYKQREREWRNRLTLVDEGEAAGQAVCADKGRSLCDVLQSPHVWATH